MAMVITLQIQQCNGDDDNDDNDGDEVYGR